MKKAIVVAAALAFLVLPGCPGEDTHECTGGGGDGGSGGGGGAPGTCHDAATDCPPPSGPCITVRCDITQNCVELPYWDGTPECPGPPASTR